MILEAHHIVKRYGEFCALDLDSLELPEGEVYGLLGPNGAGKSTFIRILNRITAPDEGEIRLFGRPLNEVDLGWIGYLPEERGLYRKMKVGEQLLYLSRLKGLSRHDAQQRITQWLDRFEIATWRDRKVEELSKGMQQKVQFISTVLHEPRLLIFDEPFSGFDPINANLLRDEILRLKEQGTTVILSTHNMASVEAMCDSITLINRSRAVLQGSVSEIRRRYQGDRFLVRYYTDSTPITLPAGIEVVDSQERHELTSLQLRIDPSCPSSELIRTLNDQVRIFSFEEVVPTMEEVFIKVVKG